VGTGSTGASVDENPRQAMTTSIMSVTDDVRNFFDDLLAEDASSPLKFPDDINFAFNEHNRHHMIHSPDVVVRPGGEDFGYGHWRETTPEAADNSAAARLKLHLKPANERLRLWRAAVASARIGERGRAKRFLPPAVSARPLIVFEIHVGKLGEEARRLRPFVIACDSDRLAEFKPGGRVTATRNHLLGHARLFLPVAWDAPAGGGGELAMEASRLPAKAAVDVWVDFPTSEIDNQIANLLLDREVGLYVCLGGNAAISKRPVNA
jgi:hypothetical protein